MDMRKKLEEKVFSYIEKNHMIDPGDGVVAGISGGADSVCLLFVLLKLRQKMPFTLSVVHVNHGIRDTAKEDERFVEVLCKEKEIPYYPVHADVPSLSRMTGESCEEAGRRVRYEAFAKTAEETGACRIAVAHNRNDCAETLLFHLFRGCGIRGLSGIRPVRKIQTESGFAGEIIRPVMCLDRSEIEEYLQAEGIRYCMDETNDEDHYTRNKIRHHILPYAEQEIAAGSAAHLSQTAGLLAEVSDYLDIRTKEALDCCVEKDGKDTGNYVINIAGFQKQHPLIQKNLLHHLILTLTPHEKDIAYIHVESLLSLIDGSGNGSIDLPFGVVGRREYGKLLLCRETGKKKAGQKKTEQERAGKGKNEQNAAEKPVEIFPFQDDETGIRLEILDRDQCFGSLPELFHTDPGEGETTDAKKERNAVPIRKKCTKWFDYDKIEGTLVLRHRRQGDYLTIFDRERGEVHKLLKQFFIDKKVPDKERDQVLLLADGSHIIWVVGYRISEHYKVKENTKRILKAETV